MNSSNPASISSQRLANIEWLRIFAMAMIVVSHFLYHYLRLHCNISFNVTTISGAANYSLLELISIFASTGVNCFVLITGYFLAEKTTWRTRGLLHIVALTVTWSVVLYLAFCLFGGSRAVFSPAELLTYLSPIPLHAYWFVGQYVALTLLAPFLARGVAGFSKRTYAALLAVLLVLLLEWPFGNVLGSGMSLQWFCFLFLSGGYLRRFGSPAWLSRHAVAIALAIAATLFLVHTAANAAAFWKSGTPFQLKSDANNSVMFFLSLAIFLSFLKWQAKGSLATFALRLAPLTFGIYLVHEYPAMRSFLWQEICPLLLPGFPVVVRLFAVSLIVFFTAALLDFLRDRLFSLFRIDKAIAQLAKRIDTRLRI